jgi:hypothetical protein
MERPRPGELQSYVADGTFAHRRAFAAQLGNNLIHPSLVSRKLGASGADLFAPPAFPSGMSGQIPSIGTYKMFALLIDFPDYPHKADSSVYRSMLFGTGNPVNYPYEGLRSYYQRSSYGKLNLTGDVYGWYRAKSNRESYVNRAGDLIAEAMQFYGIDASQYTTSYKIIIWTGPDNGWGNFWWAYYTGSYSWQWEATSPRVVIHETGHALGLPDYYDYDENVGPSGGLGGLDMMDGNWGDHNCFSKWLLDWLSPVWIANAAETRDFVLSPSALAPEAVAVMPG